FNMYEALEYCQETLMSYGGHAQAAGFSVEKGKIGDLREKINDYAARVFRDTPATPSLELDCLISLEDVSESLIGEIEQLSPYGHGNPVPLLGCRGASVLACREVGKTGAHLKMVVQENKTVVEGIGFNLAGESDSDKVCKGQHVDLAFTPGINEWNGRRSVQLEVVDLQNSAIPTLNTVCGDNGGDISCAREVTPEALAQVGHLLFTPDYIKEKISRHYGNGEGKIPSDRGATVGLGGRIKDFRHKAIDANWLSDHSRSILLVSTPYQTVETAYYLRKTMGEGMAPIGFYHPIINEIYRKDVLAEFEGGLIDTLVCTYDSVGEVTFNDLMNVAAYRLPFSTTEIGNVLSLWNKGLSFDFRLMYDSTDISFNRHKLRAFAPGREWLGAFYLLLKKHSDKTNGKFTFKTRAMIRALRTMKFSAVEAYTIKIALTILSELKLLDCCEIEQGWHIQLGHHPSRKLNLEDAKTYMWAQRLQDELLLEQDRLLEASVEELFA
ncbi:MAG TPA: hypothetical protein VFD15_05975, partial [Clostridia bacterium]|nr:hypothetical protein [Clostridia bacterium]